MFVVKNVDTGHYAKHINGTERWDVIDNIEKAQHFNSLEWANEIAFWWLDHTKKWVIVDRDTGKEYPKTVGKYHP